MFNRRRVLVALAAMGMGAASIPAVAQVVPNEVVMSLDPGESVDVTKTVTTPEIPPNPDIVFLSDTTGSMGSAIANVKANATDIDQLATGAVTYRPDSTRIIVWFGDAPGHDPRNGVTLAQAIDDLVDNDVRVIAVDLRTLNATGQAVAIADATNGSYLVSASPDDVAATILDGLTNLPVEVTPAPTCDDGLSLSFDPPSQTVTSGDDAVFTETISVDPVRPRVSTSSARFASCSTAWTPATTSCRRSASRSTTSSHPR